MKHLLTALTLLLALTASAQESSKKVATIDILTSAECGMCEERIEQEIAFHKGVKDVDLDVETKVLHITYRADKVSPETLRNAVAKIGYDADDTKAVEAAYDKLPA